MQILESFGSVEFVFVIFLQVEPFDAAYHDVRIDVIDPSVFNDVNILYAVDVAASQYCAGVMRLVYIFKDDSDVTSSVV